MRKKPRRKTTKSRQQLPAVEAPAWTWKRDGLLAAVAVLVALAAFANSLGNGYAYDDVPMIRNNPRLDRPGDLGTFFGTSYWGEVQEGAALYRPLTVMSFAVDRTLFGPGPFGVHLMNVLANAVIAGLAYAVVFRLLSRRDIALLTALVFGIHPVHTEVVANGVGRSELYATVTLLTASLLHLTYVLRTREGRSANRRSRTTRGGRSRGIGGRLALLGGAVALYFVGMLFKESAAVLPGLLFLMEWLILERARLRPMLPRMGRYLIYVLPLVVFLVIRVSVVGADIPAVQEVMAGTTGEQRLLHSSETMLRYVGQFAFPLWLCAEYSDYTHLIHPSATDPLVLASLLAWPAVMLLAYLLVRKKRFIPLLGMAWFLLAMLPTSNLIFPIGTIRADRLLFLPSLGFALMVAYGLAELARIRRKPAVLIMVLMLGFYGWRTISRNRAWLSQESLWAVTVQDNPGSAIAWAFVGDNYRAKDQHQQAAEAYQRSYQLRDGAGFFYTESHNNYAQMMVKLGDRAAAETHYRLVLGKRPGQHTALVNLGELLLHEAETRSESIELLRRATRVKPNRVEGYVNLAQALKLAGQFQQATRTIDQALQVQPENALLWEIKAECLQLAGEDRPEKGSG